MLTKIDIKKLEEKFVTKDEFKSLKDEVRSLRDEMRAGFQDMTKGFQTLIDMFGKVFNKQDEHDKTLANHEERLQKVEKETFTQN